MKLILPLLTLLLSASTLLSQELVVFGRIINSSIEPITEAKIQSQKSTRYTYSSSNGVFSIVVEIDDRLYVSHPDYQGQFIEITSYIHEKVTDKLEVSIMLHTKIDVFDLSLEDLMQMEVTSVSKISQPIGEAPQTINVITEDDIRSRGYTDIEQIIHDLPGFDISRGYGTEYSQIYQRGYRSNNTDRTLFLIDGVEENDLWSGSAWLGRQFSLNQIKRIEVVYGPTTTLYGPNAFMGAINVVTKDAVDLIPSNHWYGASAHVGYGTWNTRFTDISLAAKHKDISFFLTGRIYQSDEMDLSKYSDWDYNLNPYTIDYYKEILGTESNEIASIAQELDMQGYNYSPSLNGIKPVYANQTDNYYLHGKLNLNNFTLGFETFKRKDGYGAWYRDEFELGTEHDCYWIPKNTFFYAKYNEKVSDKLNINSFTSFRQHGLSGESKELYFHGYLNGEYDISGIVDDEGNILPDDEQRKPFWWVGYYHTYSYQLRSEFRTDYEVTSKLNFVTGIEYRHSHIQGEYLFSEEKIPEETGFQVDIQGGNHFYSNDFGIFTQANYQPLNRLFIVAGGRFDHNTIRKTGGYGLVFNPKIAVIYSPNGLVLKAIYSEAFKDASFWTKYSTTPGRLLNNPGLPPEKVKNIDASVGWKLSSIAYIDLTGFYAVYDGVVGTAEVTFTDDEGDIITTTQHQPIGSLDISGLQSNINFKLNNYTAYVNYTFTNPYNTTGTKRVRIGDIASHQINIGANANFKTTTMSLRCNWVGKKETGKNTTISANPFDFIDPYFVMNGAISQKIWKGISAQISIFNIFNTEYFHPGVRSANGTYYAARLPQYERHLMAKLIVEL
jgi:outer membrane receptor for ferrienterochelin and colicin